MRRTLSLGILLLVGVLSASHYKISLLPSARQQDPRPSRAELPSPSVASSLKSAGLAAPSEIESGLPGILPNPVIVRNNRAESKSIFEPEYLQPHVFRALSTDLPPPLPLALRS